MIARLKTFRLGVWGVTSMLLASFLVADAYTLLQLRKYLTPWYSYGWLEQPVTNLYLSFHPAREYTTTNAIKSETWRVREVRTGDAVC